MWRKVVGGSNTRAFTAVLCCGLLAAGAAGLLFFHQRRCQQQLVKRKAGKETRRKNETNLRWVNTEDGQVSFDLDAHYEMGETLGSGSYGVVVSAVDTKRGEQVAIKKVASAFDDMLDAKRMVREIRLLRQLNHKNIITMVDLLPPPSVNTFKDIYMVFDRMDTDLDRMIQIVGSNLEEDRYKSIFYQILCGSCHMHSARVLHRDLKPANILLKENGDVKICDFGLARSLGGASDFEDPNSADSVDLTKYVASRWWRAPEVLLDAKYGTSIDVWSAGCIMAEMLQGEPLFMGSTTAEMLRLIVQFTGKPSKADVNFVTSRKARKYVLGMAEGPRASLPTQFPGAGRDALDLLARMLTFDPAKRISARDAMRHPWLAKFYKVADETPAPKPADLAAVEDPSLTRQNLQQLMFEDVCAYRPECRAMAPGET